jgi:hypothetical protein
VYDCTLAHSLNSATILANSLVHSKLDYCNSLLYGLPATSTIRLQRVQNSLARVVCRLILPNTALIPPLFFINYIGCLLLNVSNIKLLYLPLRYFTLDNLLTSQILCLYIDPLAVFVPLIHSYWLFLIYALLLVGVPSLLLLLQYGILFRHIFVSVTLSLLFVVNLRLIFSSLIILVLETLFSW